MRVPLVGRTRVVLSNTKNNLGERTPVEFGKKITDQWSVIFFA